MFATKRAAKRVHDPRLVGGHSREKERENEIQRAAECLLRNFSPLEGEPTLRHRGARDGEREKKVEGRETERRAVRERERGGERSEVCGGGRDGGRGSEAPLVSFRFLIRTSFGTLGFK